jgi:hypothetical protein
MKLISTLIMKTMAGALFMLIATMAFGRNNSVSESRRVFWNKFTVEVGKNSSIILTWNVTEYNNKSFIVQHSVDGLNWEEIALVQSKNSPESMTDYSYTYFTKSTGKQYFRLKDIDVDLGSTGFSPVKTLMLETEKQVVTIWPNPVTSYVEISNDVINKFTKARVIDLSGKVMIEKNLEADVTEISVASLVAGTYIVRMENSKGVYYSQKIVKQ